MTTDRERALRAADAIGLHEDSCHSAWSPDLECDCDALRTRHLVADALLAAEQRGRQYSWDHLRGLSCMGDSCECRDRHYQRGVAEGERRVRETGCVTCGPMFEHPNICCCEGDCSDCHPPEGE